MREAEEAGEIIAEAGVTVAQAYSLLQISFRSDLTKSDVTTVVRNLARALHVAALASLAPCVVAV